MRSLGLVHYFFDCWKQTAATVDSPSLFAIPAARVILSLRVL